MQELFDAILLSRTVHVWYFIFRQRAVILMDLFRFESGWHPSILLKSTARVIVRCRVPLEVVHQFGHRLLHLQRHGSHNMLLTRALTVETDFPFTVNEDERVRCRSSWIDQSTRYTFPPQKAFIWRTFTSPQTSARNDSTRKSLSSAPDRQHSSPRKGMFLERHVSSSDTFDKACIKTPGSPQIQRDSPWFIQQ